MFVSHINNNQISHESIEDINNPQTAEHIEENVIDQEAPNATKDLPNIFALQAQAKSNSVELVDVFLKYGTYPWHINRAMAAKDYRAVQLLVEHGVNMNIRWEEGTYESDTFQTSGRDGKEYAKTVGKASKTILEIAFNRNEGEFAKYLIENGADPYSFRENSGYTIMHRNPIQKEIPDPITGRFIERVYYQSTAVFDIINSGNLDLLKILVDAKVDLNQICVKDYYCMPSGKQNFTPLQYALKLEKKEIAAFLIDHGARLT